MFRVVPSRTHPIYVEWKKWFYKSEEAKTHDELMLCCDAKRSIEMIAEHAYPDVVIVGHMIMMKDQEEMEAEDESNEAEG